MAGEAEEKKISKLDFDINNAIKKLETIDNKLKEISQTSEKYAKTIGNAINQSINKGVTIDTKSIQKDMDTIVNKDTVLKRNLILQNNKHNNKIQEMNHRTALKQIEDNNKILQSTQTISDKISNYAKTYLIYQGFNELKTAINETIEEMVDLEYQMVEIDRVLNESTLDIDNYRDKLIQLAYDYGNSFNNVADITKRLAQAGFDSQESLALTEKTLLALNTAELDAEEATSDMIAVMAQWGKMTGTAAEQGEWYGEVIDKINKVADTYPTTSEDILNALKKTSSAFNLAGASIDETIALITTAEVASQRGGKVIGTALSNIAQQLKAEGRLNIAESLGLDFYTDETETQFKGIIEIFTEMAEKMQQLKDAGKENSVEMQELLSIFTVFRRNIGASLLGEMSGEDSTYFKVLNDSLTATGYSLQENEKHMKTARAAQAQFNATLLELKTTVWDGGVEEVFRGLLSFGTDFVGGINKLVDNIGLLPTAVGAATLAFTLFNKSTQAGNLMSAASSIKQIKNLYDDTAKGIADVTQYQNSYNTILSNSNKTFQAYSKTVSRGSQSLSGYIKYLTTSTAKTIALTAKTIILQSVISLGLSAAITFVVSAVDNWINAEEKAIEKSKELMQTSQDNATKLQDEISSLQELRKEYEELAKKDNRTVEDDNRIYEIQTKINDAVKDTSKYVELITTKTNEQGESVQAVNDKYDEQLEKIKSIEYEKKKNEVEELRRAAEEAKKQMTGITTENTDANWWKLLWHTDELDAMTDALKDINFEAQKYVDILDKARGDDLVSSTVGDNLDKAFDYYGMLNFIQWADYEQQVEGFNLFRQALVEAKKEGKDYSEIIENIDGYLEVLESQQNSATEAIQKYEDALSELYAMSGQIDVFDTFLSSIAESYNVFENTSMEGPKELINDLKSINDEFSNGKIEVEEYFNKIQNKIKEINFSATGEELEAYQAIFAATTQSMAEGISSLNSGLESGTISFADYANGIKEAGDNALELYTLQNDISFDGENWINNATGQVDEYANSLAYANGRLNEMGDILKVVADNYDYIAEHANAAGEVIFKQTDETSAAYQKLATEMTASLNQMAKDTPKAFESITQSIANEIKISTNEMINASGYLNEGFLNNYSNMNGALNAVANATQIATKNVTNSMGNVLTKLGEAISGFEYKITGTPFIEGGFSLQTNDMGIPTGLSLPSFGFKITGQGGSSVQELGSALSEFGQNLSTLGELNFAYNKLKPQTPYTSGSAPRSPGGTGGGSSSKGGGSSSSDAEREAEEEYKRRLALFTGYIDEVEREEQRWVKKQKELGTLSYEDERYIIQQRIARYEKYLKQIKQMTWLSTEDRLKLEKEYTEEIEDLQLDYMGLLKDELEDEIDAIEKANKEKIKALEDTADKRIDKLKEDNKTAIELIEKEADAQIEALKAVEKENDRIRAKEEYERNRQAHLDDISYWEQRTGREAQEALLEARKRLEELDRDWEQQLEDWEIEDKIAKIEEERDAKIEAIEAEEERTIESIETTRDAEIAAIEAAQEREIEALQKVYDAKVKMYSETSQIIYDASVIESQALYNAYKTNFIDPISSELQKMYAQAPAPAAVQKAYETYTIKRGDTLSAIAKRYGTTVSKLMEANPYITNKNMIYAGKTLQIPKFHEGGIVGGNQEAFALLKPNEVILKTEWAASLNRMMKYFDNLTMNNSSAVSTGPTIEVNGDLIKIEANVRNQNDINNIEKKVEKVLKDKFNIKK